MRDLLGTMSCEEVIWLLEAVGDPDHQADQRLINFVQGNSQGSAPDKSQLITWLEQLSRNMGCEPESTDENCAVVERARLNLQ